MAQPNQLITLTDFKLWRRLSPLPSDDDVISSYIDEVSDEVQRFCRRVFRRATITDEPHEGDGSRTLRVNRPPITSVAAVNVDGVTLDPSAYVVPTLASDTNSEVDFNDGRIVLLARTFPVGYRILVSYVGGFATTPAPVRQACRELVATRYATAGRDLSVVIESAGSDGGSIDRRGSDGMPRAVKKKLVAYRLPLAAGLQPGAYERTRSAAW